MKRMAVKLLSIAVMMALWLTVLSGCGGSDSTITDGSQAGNSVASSTTGQASSAPAEKAKIQLFSISVSAQEDITTMIDKYNKDNKDNIEVELMFRSGDWQTPLNTSLSAGQAPDLMMAVPDYYAAILNNWIEPWDKYVSEDFKNKVGPYSFKESINGQKYIYYFVYNTKTKRMVYNKDIFKEVGLAEPPKSWEQFREYARLITEKGNGKYYGAAFALKNISFYTDAVMNYEGIYNSWDYINGGFKFSTLAPYLEIWRKVIEDKSVFPGFESMDQDGLRAQFASGKIGMYTGALSWDVKALNDQFKATCDWSVAPVPTLDGKESKFPMGLRVGGGYYLSATSKYKQQCGKLIEYLMGDEYLGMYYEKGIDMITVPSAVQNAKAPTGDNMKQWAEFAPLSNEIPAINGPSVPPVDGETSDESIVKILTGAAKDITKTLDEIDKRYDEAFKEQAALDLEKAKSNSVVIDKLGKLPIMPDFGSGNYDLNNVKFITVEEWQNMKK